MTALEQLRQHLVQVVFARAVARDPELVAAVESFDGDVHFDGSDLMFTLPDVYRFALTHLDASGRGPLDAARCDYKAFRRMLYQSALNAELRRLGAVVIIERANHDNALSLYRLTRLSD